MNNGKAAAFQDNSVHGEDCFLIRELSDSSYLDAVLDGVTQCGGEYAARFTADVLWNTQIEGLEALLEALEGAARSLFERGRGRNLLTTVSVALKLGDDLHVVNVGDSPVYLVRAGVVEELTAIGRPGLLTGLVGGMLGLRQEFTYHHRQSTLRSGDRLVLATDGLVNNMPTEEFGSVVSGASSPDYAVAAIKRMLEEKAGAPDFYLSRKDDQTAVIRYL